PPGAAHPPGGVGAALGAGPADGHGPLPGVEDGPRREPLGPVAHRLDDHLAPDAVRLDDAADLQAACGRLERLRGAPGTAAFLFRQSKPRFARCSVGQSTMSRLARTPSLVPAAATTWRRAWATRPRRPITLPMSDGDTWRRSSQAPEIVSSRCTCSVGWAPLRSHASARSLSMSTRGGSSRGPYFPMISTKRPSRGDRASATTTRYVGCFFLPIRMRRIFTTGIPLYSKTTGEGYRPRRPGGDLTRPGYIPGIPGIPGTF